MSIDIRIAIVTIDTSIWISIMSISVWMYKTVVYNRCGFNFNLLNYRSIVYNRGMISISKIPGVCFRISFRFSFTLLALCFNSWSFLLSRCSYGKWKSIIRIAKVTSIWESSVAIDQGSSFHFHGFHLHSLDNWSVHNSVCCSIHKWSAGKEQLGIRLCISISMNSGKESNHQQKLHVVPAL